LKNLEVKPGDVVVTDMGVYQHWSLVSNKRSEDGEYMLISASDRKKTVAEEHWHATTHGKLTYVAEHQAIFPVDEVLRNARSMIGKWKYNVTNRNCEHFVNFVTKGELTSKQVKAGLAAGTIGALAAAALSDDPKVVKVAGVALLCAGVAVFASKAAEKSTRLKTA